MFLLRNLLNASAAILDSLIGLYMLLVFGRIVMSWVNADPHNPIVQFLYQVTEPALRPIRRRLGIYSGVDFAPMILILGLVFLRAFLVATIYDIARMM